MKWVVDLFREAMAAGGRLILNEGDPDAETVFHAEPHFLLQELDNFIRDGTFLWDIDLRPVYAKHLAKEAGPRFEDKVRAVAEKLHVSERTAARFISPAVRARKPKRSAPK